MQYLELLKKLKIIINYDMCIVSCGRKWECVLLNFCPNCSVCSIYCVPLGMEDGCRFRHFWWFYARVYYVYILIDQPYSDRNLMVLWAKAPGFNARHFAVLWFDPQSSHIFFMKLIFHSLFFFVLI